jgi:peptidylprolyl isomerase
MRLLAIAFLLAGAAPEAPDRATVPVSSGNHPTFGRVVFAAPPGVTYSLTRHSDQVTIHFTGGVTLGRAPTPPRNVVSIHAEAQQADLVVATGATLHDMRMGTRIVLDVFDPVAGQPAADRPPTVTVPLDATHRVVLPPALPAKTDAVSAADTAAQLAVEPSPPTQPIPGATTGSVANAAAKPPDSAKGIVAQRGDIKLTVADIRAMLNHVDPVLRTQALATPAALAEFVRNRLVLETLLAEAHATHWDQKPDVIAQAEEARKAAVAQTYLASRTPLAQDYPSPAEVVAAYEANKPSFTIPQQYHLAQIAIYVPPDASTSLDQEARLQAQDLRQRALGPDADFAALARSHSQDHATAAQGGDLGWLRADRIAPPLLDVVTGLADNAISEPVRSANAWLILKVLGTKPPSVQPLEEVRASLVQALRQTAAQNAGRAYVEGLLRQQPVMLDEINLTGQIATGH